MATGTSCQPCRSGKTKCDQQRPTCGRCARRGTECYGYVEGSDFVFRDERDRARTNSQRRESKSSRTKNRTISLSFPADPVTQDDRSLVALTYSWLNEPTISQIPLSITGDLEARVVDRFFSRWVLYPSDKNPGYLHYLPAIYETVHPGSALRLAIEASAYADMSNEATYAPGLGMKARSKYGAALQHLRTVLAEGQQINHDSVLAALIVIENFELMHLRRKDFTGLHTKGLMHVLLARGHAQFFSQQGFALWRIAHHKLLAHQLLLKQAPIAEQEQWISMVDTNRPDFHIGSDVHKVVKLCALARQCIETSLVTKEADDGIVFRSMLDLDTSMAHWKLNLTPNWLSRTVEVAAVHSADSASHIYPVQWPDKLILYSHRWVANIWNFHNVARIALKDALLELSFYTKSLTTNLDVNVQKEAIADLSLSIIQSLPMVLGFVNSDGECQENSTTHANEGVGKGLAGYFGLVHLWILQNSRHVPAQDKVTAGVISEWVRSQNAAP